MAERHEQRGRTRLPQILSASMDEPFGPSIANRLFHPHLQKLRKRLESVTSQRILLSHGITDLAIEALRAGDAPRFLALRAEFLTQHLERFFASRARWDESDRPALGALIVTDDDDEEDGRQDLGARKE